MADSVWWVRYRTAQALLALPGAEPAEMGTGRTMGPSWINVEPDALATDEQLSFWLGVALDYNSRAGTR